VPTLEHDLPKNWRTFSRQPDDAAPITGWPSRTERAALRSCPLPFRKIAMDPAVIMPALQRKVATPVKVSMGRFIEIPATAQPALAADGTEERFLLFSY